jgi:hypothetical protein
MNRPKVVHCKRDPYDVYIGRGSIWGNPYTHKDGTMAKYIVDSREEAIAKFEEYLLANENLMSKIGELRGKTLGCFCKPNKKCHGDILLKYANAPQKLF